ncbi:2-oxoglutarate dehydrogenase, E2 component, dihydrolipoamide succinyltransferase [Microbacterium gubbeenense]|uniref:2-oxoglutarate dehydrogenase, E2 component, dihydrolipoamide succinyltransferase n=4 Tax=Microbacterium gubbeenense TaxID=159896 RepID=UPI0004020FD4|nr:2-oxoglutarate dehydrogenase, E2 component, dihydrolipoamide succinyltransferase [Microbacterium gubbeenense]
MSTSVVLPALGESVTEGTVTRWLKQVGDTVEVDEPLLEVSTDKVDTEIPSPVAGVLQSIAVDEDETVEVGAELATIGDGSGSSEAPAAPAEEAPAAPEAPKAEAEAPAAPASDAPAASGDATDVTLPELGESVTEGTVTRWLKQVGDTVDVDEPLLEISTDKVDTEVPSPVAGTVLELLAAEDDTVEVGAVLARVGSGTPATAPQEEAPKAEAPQAETPKAEAPQAEAPAAAEAPKAETEAPAASGDATDVTLPELGESVTEGTVTRWLKQVGDTVDVDEPLLEISTDKVDTEVPSLVAGTVLELLAAEDDTVGVGAVLARVGSGAPAAAPQEEAPKAEAPKAEAPKAEAPKAEAPKAEAPKAEASKPAQAPAAGADTVYVTPLVRKLAAQHGVDLASVSGTGVGGRIRKDDVLAAAKSAPTGSASAPAPAAAPATQLETSELRGTTQPMSRLRKVVSSRAVESLNTTAQLTTIVEVDVTKLAQFRDQKKNEFLEKSGQKLSFLSFFSLAAVEALKAYPIINSTLDGENIVYPEQENLSIAVDTPKGLYTPVLRDASSKSLAEIASGIADLAARTRDGKLKPDDLAGGTFTITNTGSRGALFDTPLVFLPQSAILGTGIVYKRPGVTKVDGADAIGVRSYVYLALSYDHRTIDGADAARYLSAVKNRLEEANFAANLGL